MDDRKIWYLTAQLNNISHISNCGENGKVDELKKPGSEKTHYQALNYDVLVTSPECLSRTLIPI